MAPIPNVVPGQIVRASEQNDLIDRVNEHTEQIADLQVPGGDLGPVEELIEVAVTDHVADTTPHPAYDDLPSLRLLFENGLV